MNSEYIPYSLPQLTLNIKTLNILKEGYLRDMHIHEEIEIVCANTGDVLCIINDEEVVLNHGEFILINRRVAHRILYYKNPAQLTYIQLNIDNYVNFLIPGGEHYIYSFINDTNRLKYLKVCDGELPFIFSQLKKEAELNLPSSPFYIKAYIFRVIAFMTRYRLLSDNSSTTLSRSVSKIMPVLKFIDDSYNTKITLDDVSDILNINKFYFCKLFKEITNSNFIDYVNYIRIRHAEDFLINTDKNISEIAFECGFTSLQYFNKTFKKYKNCTPKVYRNL